MIESNSTSIWDVLHVNFRCIAGRRYRRETMFWIALPIEMAFSYSPDIGNFLSIFVGNGGLGASAVLRNTRTALDLHRAPGEGVVRGLA